MKVQLVKAIAVVFGDDDCTTKLVGICGRAVRRDTSQTLLEPGMVWRSAGFAALDFARVTPGLLVPRRARG